MSLIYDFNFYFETMISSFAQKKILTTIASALLCILAAGE